MHPGTWQLLKHQVAHMFAPRLAWLFVCIVLLSLFCLFAVRHEPLVRWWGMVLQLVGVWPS
jgi:hypothetical protein